MSTESVIFSSARLLVELIFLEEASTFSSLAPSWGNRIISLPQFFAMRETREEADYKGKVPLMLPEQASTTTHPEFFAPLPDNILPLEARMLRNF